MSIHDALDEANRQLTDYRALRAAKPDDFGHTMEGQMDGTPHHGPMPLPLAWVDGDGTGWRVLWGMHKYPFPMSFCYCIGKASDSRGERTDRALTLDIRDMPANFIGRYRIDSDPGCGRRSHRAVLTRALEAGFDLEAHCLAVNAAREAEWQTSRGAMISADILDLEVPF